MQKLAARCRRQQSGRCTKPFCIPAWIILLNISGCKITGLSQQAGLFTMSAKKGHAGASRTSTIPCSTAITTARSEPAGGRPGCSSDRPLRKLAEHYGIMFFYRGRTPIAGNWRRSLMASGIPMVLSVIPVSVDGVIQSAVARIPPGLTQGQAQRLGVKYFPAMIAGVTRNRAVFAPLSSYGFYFAGRTWQNSS